MKYLKVFETKTKLQNQIELDKEEIKNFLLDINSRVGEDVKLEMLKTSKHLYCRIGKLDTENTIHTSPENFDIIELSLEISELKERMYEIGYEIVNYHMDYLKVSMAGTGPLKLLLIFRKPI